MGLLSQYMCERAQGTRHAIVIDPADQTPDIAANRALAAAHAGSQMILVGGSSDTDMENVHATIVAIKEALELVTWASSQDSDSVEDPNQIRLLERCLCRPHCRLANQLVGQRFLQGFRMPFPILVQVYQIPAKGPQSLERTVRSPYYRTTSIRTSDNRQSLSTIPYS